MKHSHDNGRGMGLKENYERSRAKDERRNKDAKALIGFGKKTFRHPDRIIRFTWWVAAFTCGLVFVGFVQAWSFIQSERAFVSLATASFTAGPPKGLIDVAIKNSGRISATVHRMAVAISNELPPIPDYPPLAPIALSPIVPDGTIQYHLELGPSANDSALIEKIIPGAVTFYFYGMIEYEDGFSILGYRKNGFCYQYNPNGNRVVSVFNTCTERAYTYSH